MTNADLIADARRTPGDLVLQKWADALEASEVQVARLRSHLTYRGHEDDKAVAWPTDLLEAVQALYYGADHEHIHDVAMCSLCKARATLVHYGLVEGEHARNA